VVFAATWEKQGPLTAGVRLGGIVLVCVLIVAGTVYISNLRHDSAGQVSDLKDTLQGQHDGARPGTGIFLFMTILMPAASAYIQRQIGQSSYWKTRRDIQAQQAKFDRDENAQRRATKRRADALALLQRKQARLEEQFAQLQARRLALASQVLSAQQAWLKYLKQARAAVERYTRTLLAALEQDHIQYLRAAYRAQSSPLVTEEERCQSGAGMSPPWQVVRPLLSAGRNGYES
jgi:hypothetical protein